MSSVKQRPTPASTSQPSGSSTAAGEKRQLPPPTTFSDMVTAIVLHVCRKYLFLDISYKIGFYCIFVTILSFFGELAPLSRSFYLATSRNVLNDYFVKWGLLWTLALLSPFVYYTSKVYSANDKRNIRQQMARLIVAVFVWFVCTRVFVHVERVSGFCTKSAYPDRSACVVGKGRWLSFDISGHCFLLIYCCLTIAEETKVFRNWDRIRSLLNKARATGIDPPEAALVTDREKTIIQEQHAKYTIWIRLLFLALTSLHLLWDFMLAITALYFHNWPQKIAGVAVATGAWYATYGFWYKMQRSPGVPGHCKLKYHKKIPNARM